MKKGPGHLIRPADRPMRDPHNHAITVLMIQNL